MGQPGYGAPAQAANPGFGIGVSGWSGGAPRIAVATGGFSTGGFLELVIKGHGVENPRKYGAIAFGISFVCGVLNLIIIFALNIYFPYLFLVAGPFGWAGLFMLITGEPLDRKDGSLVPAWARFGLLGCTAIGLLLGIGAIIGVHG